MSTLIKLIKKIPNTAILNIYEMCGPKIQFLDKNIVVEIKELKKIFQTNPIILSLRLTFHSYIKNGGRIERGGIDKWSDLEQELKLHDNYKIYIGNSNKLQLKNLKKEYTSTSSTPVSYKCNYYGGENGDYNIITEKHFTGCKIKKGNDKLYRILYGKYK